jgi:ethanolamine ammonia-lyase large subunit
MQRLRGQFDRELYLRVLGSANEFKEGDEILGIAAADESSRRIARELLAQTRLRDIDQLPPRSDRLWSDELFQFITRTPATANSARDSHAEADTDAEPSAEFARLTLGELKAFLLTRDEADIHQIKDGLSSDVIACVVKLMSNAELMAVGAKVFNPLPNSQIGAKGYLGARIQPNSPTDNLEDIRWQVFNGFSYAVGDVLLGTNPVSSDPESVAQIELALQEILRTFALTEAMPHCVLAHIDVQADVEGRYPGSTELWFQSIAGNDNANHTFDISVAKMVAHARGRTTGTYGLYFETGQGADFTNGHGYGMDMVIYESRKYGFARALTETAREARIAAGLSADTWVHVNDVAGFIGPEVFRSKEQLVRCCLEDIVMGKLHGLTIGLDVCSTLHMDVSLDDLDWCLEQVAPASPAYLMALPTKIDPMLGYLTTGFQDHVRLREQFGTQVNDRMWDFFKSLGVIDADGQPTKHFGDPNWVYLQYRRRGGDQRSDQEIFAEGRSQLAAIRQRGVFIAEGHGDQPWELNASLQREITTIYADAKQSIWKEWEDEFVAQLPNVVRLSTRSIDREDYILHPTSGEQLAEPSLQTVLSLKAEARDKYNCWIIVSEGLNALAAMDEGQLMPLVAGLRSSLAASDLRIAPQLLVIDSGRVRAGYRIGETLFQGVTGPHTILHVIGERPGSGHHTLSVYITTADGTAWSIPDQVDHNITRVVSGIATTALKPELAVEECVKLLV